MDMNRIEETYPLRDSGHCENGNAVGFYPNGTSSEHNYESENGYAVDVKLKVRRDSSSSEESYEQDNEQRGEWGHKVEFFLAIMGYTVGIGSVWRFPITCSRNGGGAFLIPFFFFLITAGGPLYYMEVCLGQFTGKSAGLAFEFCPLLKGKVSINAMGKGARFICAYLHNIITNTCLFKYIENFTSKNWKFSDKKIRYFSYFCSNIDCGYTLEPPRWGGSNEYPHSMFLSRNKNNNVYPCKPQFYYIKVGFKGVNII